MDHAGRMDHTGRVNHAGRVEHVGSETVEPARIAVPAAEAGGHGQDVD